MECIKYRWRAFIIRPPINSNCAIEMILSWRKKWTVISWIFHEQMRSIILSTLLSHSSRIFLFVDTTKIAQEKEAILDFDKKRRLNQFPFFPSTNKRTFYYSINRKIRCSLWWVFGLWWLNNNLATLMTWDSTSLHQQNIPAQHRHTPALASVICNYLQC